MVAFALNQITVPNVPFGAFVALAKRMGCVGIEARNDMGRPLFDGMDPAEAGALVRDHGLRLLGLSQVYPFNVWSEERAAEAQALIDSAVASGAETISLIPLNEGADLTCDLCHAIQKILPMLDGSEVTGLIEPLGFARSSLRDKAELVAEIVALSAEHRIKLVHDTFHHCLAGAGPVYAEATGMVHISGVTDPDLTLAQMEDEHRVLVDGADRLESVAQIIALQRAGYAGPVSFECFAPEVQGMEDPGPAIQRSMNFISSQLQAKAA